MTTTEIRQALLQRDLKPACEAAAAIAEVRTPSGSPWQDDPVWCAYVLREALTRLQVFEDKARKAALDAQQDRNAISDAYTLAKELLVAHVNGATK